MLSKVTPFARCRGLQEAVHQVKDLQRRCLPLPPWECACVEDEPVVVRSLEALVKCEAGFLLLKEISCRVVGGPQVRPVVLRVPVASHPCILLLT